MDFLRNIIDFQDFLDLTGEVCPKIEISGDVQIQKIQVLRILT